MVSRLSAITPAALSSLAPLGKALASKACKLQLLHLDHADVEHRNLSALVDGLLANETVVNLRLGENGLAAKAAAVLAKLLRGNQTLTSLDVRENRRAYLRSWFVIDVVTSVPYDRFIASSAASMIAVLKVLKGIRDYRVHKHT